MINLRGNMPPSSDFKQYAVEDPSVAFRYLLSQGSKLYKSLSQFGPYFTLTCEHVRIFLKQTNQLCTPVKPSHLLPACDAPLKRTSTRMKSFIPNGRSKYKYYQIVNKTNFFTIRLDNGS